MKTLQQSTQAWIDSAPRAATNYETGVNNYSGDWAAATVRQKTVMAQNYATSVNNGTWEAGVNRVNTAGWKSRTQAKITNFSSGFTAGASRQASAMGKILTAEANLLSTAPPRGTYEQNKQRATYFMDGLHALKGTLGAS